MAHATHDTHVIRPNRWTRNYGASRESLHQDAGLMGLALMAIAGCITGYVILSATTYTALSSPAF